MILKNRLLKYVSRETLEKYNVYYEQLKQWNKAIKLVQPDTLDHYWERHILDSVQIIPLIEENYILDIGSGAGFPGMALAITGRYKMTLCESNVKKYMFLNEVKRILGVEVDVLNERVESIKDRKYELIVSRACASLDLLFELSQNVSRETSTRFLLHKGESYQKEIEEAQKKWSFTYTKINSITPGNGVILDIRNLNKVSK